MDFELKIIEFLQSGRSQFFDVSFQTISSLGSVIGAIAVCIIFLIFNRKILFWYLFSYGFVNVTVNIIKNTVQRFRPYEMTPSIVAIGGTATDYSFPSGHTACATAIAIFMALFLFTYFRDLKSRILIVTSVSAYVLLVALSRMYLGMHYLTDVLAGFAISAVICVLGLTLAYFYYKQRHKEKNFKGKIDES